jgi:tRNA(Ile)-lysidine synthase
VPLCAGGGRRLGPIQSFRVVTMAFLGSLAAFLSETAILLPQDTVVVGVSGGPDSLCLLHALTQLRSQLGLTLHAAHLNHRLRGAESDVDEEYVRQMAAEWDVPLTVSAAEVAALAARWRIGVEQAARQARYQFLGQVAIQVAAEKVAVGHNADDQTETVLMHVLRGSGLTGLRGMLPAGPYPLPAFALTLIRPLLNVPRLAIEAYCREHQFQPRVDRSNLDPALFRNRLRHQVLPALEQVSPGVGGRLRQLAQLAAADLIVLERVLEETWKDIVRDESDAVIALDLNAWRGLPLGLRRSTLRRSIAQLHGLLDGLSFRHIENARSVAERGGTGARATLPGHLELAVSYDLLIVAPAPAAPVPAADCPTLGARSPVPLTVPGWTVLPATSWKVFARLLPANPQTRAAAYANQDTWSAYLDADRVGSELVLRPRMPGERFQPLGMGGRSSSVSDYMINSRLPADMRDRVPILSVLAGQPNQMEAGQILWIVGWRLDERVKVTEQTRRILLVSLSRTEESHPGDVW